MWEPLGGRPSTVNHANEANRDGSIAVSSDGYLYVIDPAKDRILRTMDGHVSSEIRASSDGVDRKLSEKFAVSNKDLFAMDADGLMLHVWTTEGKPVLDVDLAPQLGQSVRSAPAVAVSSRGELLVLDDRESRVLRYRINF